MKDVKYGGSSFFGGNFELCGEGGDFKVPLCEIASTAHKEKMRKDN